MTQVNGEQLMALLQYSKKAGTEHAAIDLAIEWIELAEKEILRLRKLTKECIPIVECVMPEVSTEPFPGPDAQLDADDMNLAMLCDLYHRLKKAME